MVQVVARLRTALRNARRLSPRDWWRLVLGQAALVHAWVDVRTRPRGELVRRDSGEAAPAAGDPSFQLETARRVALGVTRAAAYGVFNPTCLVRSLAIVRRFHEEGIHGGSVKVGVARRAGKFVAHAWVELAGEVIGDDEDTVERYASFDDLQVSARP
ncbi:MAG: lasso peptide biosynthesis B2 protein [Gemmatimonadaceae bacterium]